MSQLLKGWRCGLHMAVRSSCPAALDVGPSVPLVQLHLGPTQTFARHYGRLRIPPSGWSLKSWCCHWGQSWLETNVFLFCRLKRDPQETGPHGFLAELLVAADTDSLHALCPPAGNMEERSMAGIPLLAYQHCSRSPRRGMICVNPIPKRI